MVTSTCEAFDMPDTSREGWFIDPYERHEARWFSGGSPTSLVRDGAHEGSDPPPPAAPIIADPSPAVPDRTDDEVPQRTFRGQEFEVDFQGSLGYRRPDPPQPSNWTDRLVVTVFSLVRPSQLGKPGYWRHIVRVLLLGWVVTLVVLLIALWH
jgi:hypothetical protein